MIDLQYLIPQRTSRGDRIVPEINDAYITVHYQRPMGRPFYETHCNARSREGRWKWNHSYKNLQRHSKGTIQVLG